MHAWPPASPTRSTKARRRRSATTRRSPAILRGAGRRGRRRRARRRTSALDGRRRRVQRRPAGRVPHAARRRRRAPRRPPRPLLAVVPAVGGRRPRRARRRMPPTTTSTSARQWDESFDGIIQRGERMPDPSILVTLHSPRRPVAGAAGLLDALRARAGAEPRRPRRLDARPRAARERDLRRAGGGGSAIRSTSWSRSCTTRSTGRRRAWSGARRSRSPTRSARPGRSGPRNVDRRVPGLVFVGLVAPCPASACRWCSCRASWPRRPVPRPWRRDAPAAVTVDAARHSYAECRRLNKRHGTTYYWSTTLLPPVKRHHVHALYAFCRYADDIVDDLGPAPRAPSGPAAAAPTSATASSPTSSAGGPTTSVLKAVVHTVRAFDIDPDAFRRFLRSMTMDLTVESLRHVRRPARLHGRLGGGDRRDDAADPRAAATRRGARPRPATSARRSSSPTSCATSTRTSTAAASTCRRRTSRGSTSTSPTAGATPEFVALMRFEIERCRALYDSADDRHRACCPTASARCVAAAHDLYGRILDRIEAPGLRRVPERAGSRRGEGAPVQARRRRSRHLRLDARPGVAATGWRGRRRRR